MHRATALTWPIALAMLSWAGQAAVFACRIAYSEPAPLRSNATHSDATWQLRIDELAAGLGPYAFGGTIWDVFAVATARTAATLALCTLLGLASLQSSSGRLRRTLRRCVRLPPLLDAKPEAGDAHSPRPARAWLTLCCSFEWIASTLATSCVVFTLAKALARLVIGGGYPSTTCSSLFFWLEIGIDIVASLLLADGVPRALGAARVVAEDDLIAADDAAYAVGPSGPGGGGLSAALLAPGSHRTVDVELFDPASESELYTRKRKRKRTPGAGSAPGAGEESDDAIERDGGECFKVTVTFHANPSHDLTRSPSYVICTGIAPIKSRRSLYLLVRFALRDWPLLLIAFAALVVAAVGQAVIPHLTGTSALRTAHDEVFSRSSPPHPHPRPHACSRRARTPPLHRPQFKRPIETSLDAGAVIDCVVETEVNVAAFETNTLYLALVALVCSVFTALRGSVFTVTMARLNVRVRRQLYAKLLSNELGFFDIVKVGPRSRTPIRSRAPTLPRSKACASWLRRSALTFAHRALPCRSPTPPPPAPTLATTQPKPRRAI